MKYFCDDILKFSRGVEFGFKSSNVFSERKNELYPIINGGNITRYKINFDKKYVNYDENNFKIYKQKKFILMKNIS
ncbi:MAG: hypothetical protein Q9M97_06500 [Candidatus Gracilibacteria bacterium]|nr:hypothetical protein [Candidatus Gracilibacteria bacterium]